jgi:hypothetical protein
MQKSLLKRLLQRWYLIAVGLLASIGLGLGAADLSPPTYEAHGTVLMLPSKVQVTGDGMANPFLQLTTLDAPASILINRLNGSDVQDRIRQQHPEATYLAAPDMSMRGPVVAITVTDTTAEGAMNTLDDVLAMVPEVLTSLQKQVNVPNRAQVTSMPLAVDGEPTVITRATARAQVAAFGLGLLLTLAGTVGIDTLLRRRSIRRASSEDASPDEHGTDPTDADVSDIDADDGPSDDRGQRRNGRVVALTPSRQDQPSDSRSRSS